MRIVSILVMRALFSFVAVVLSLAVPAAFADVARLAQLVDYVGVDYPEAVQNGEIVNDLEYAEMQEFATLIGEEVDALPAGPTREALLGLAESLEAAIGSKVDPSAVARITGDMSRTLLVSTSLSTAPAEIPNL